MLSAGKSFVIAGPPCISIIEAASLTATGSALPPPPRTGVSSLTCSLSIIMPIIRSPTMPVAPPCANTEAVIAASPAIARRARVFSRNMKSSRCLIDTERLAL